MNQLNFDRNIDHLLAEAEPNGLWVYCGWSMPIPRAKAVEYIHTYNTDPNAGFYEHDGKVILTHNGGKLTLSAEEGAAVVDLIKTSYPEAVDPARR